MTRRDDEGAPPNPWGRRTSVPARGPAPRGPRHGAPSGASSPGASRDRAHARPHDAGPGPLPGRHREGDARRPAHARQDHRAAAPVDASTPTTAARELRLYGVNAIEAVFRARPDAIRKLWLTQARVPRLRALLAWCAQQRIGYRVVEDADLQKLAASSHHEGVVADVARTPAPAFDAWLQALPAGPVCALWLDGVGNPHNLGAILRSAAHFGVAAVLVPHGGPALSGAAARVAEGGAEAVPLVPVDTDALAALQAAGFDLVATVVDGGDDVFAAPLPARTVLVMGAEGAGMDRDLAARCTRRVSIPGTGAVESLNVAAATAVLLAQWARGSGLST